MLWLIGGENRVLSSKEIVIDQSGKCKSTIVSPFAPFQFIFISLESKIARIDGPSQRIKLTLDEKQLNAFRRECLAFYFRTQARSTRTCYRWTYGYVDLGQTL